MKIHEIPPKTKKKNIQKAISHIIFHPIFEFHEVSTSQPPMDPMDRVPRPHRPDQAAFHSLWRVVAVPEPGRFWEVCLEALTGILWEIPSGNLWHSYWKWPFIVDFPIKNGDFP